MSWPGIELFSVTSQLRGGFYTDCPSVKRNRPDKEASPSLKENLYSSGLSYACKSNFPYSGSPSERFPDKKRA